jgi:hypothetical protein
MTVFDFGDPPVSDYGRFIRSFIPNSGGGHKHFAGMPPLAQRGFQPGNVASRTM